jgi:hypothetical protein
MLLEKIMKKINFLGKMKMALMQVGKIFSSKIKIGMESI